MRGARRSSSVGTDVDDINHPLIKAVTAAGAFVSLTWIDLLTTAGKIAAALTAIAIFAEWLWKRVIHPVIVEIRALKSDDLF